MYTMILIMCVFLFKVKLKLVNVSVALFWDYLLDYYMIVLGLDVVTNHGSFFPVNTSTY